MNKKWLIGIAAGIVVVAAAATGWYLQSAKQPATKSAPTPSGTPTMAASAAPTPLGRPGVSPAAAPRCTANDMSLSLGTQNAAAGTVYTPLVWTNKSKSICSVYGYPAVALYDSNGKAVGLPASDDTSKTPMQLTVAPGKTVHATVGTHDPGNYPAGTCSGLSFKMRATLPGDTAYESATFEETYCGKWLVSPMTAGSVD